MNESTRQAMLRIADGEMEVVEYLYIVSMHRRCDEVLAWLIQNRLTGKNFLAWARGNFGRFRLDVVKFALKNIDHDKEVRPILAGRDLVVR